MNDWATKAYTKIIDTGTKWADLDAACKLLEDTKKSTLSQCKLKYTHLSSDAAKETEALASKEYMDHCEQLRHTRGEANLAKVQYEAARTLASLRQTQQSLKKAEMQLV